MINIALVTGNKNKAAEVSAILGLDIEPVNLELDEIQAIDVADVALAKAKSAFDKLGRAVIVDDTGMSIAALNGLPGAFVAWFLDALGPSGILDLLAGKTDRSASVKTCIGYADSSGVEIFTGEVFGSISTEERGTNGFGYDPIFVPAGEDKTYAQMSAEEKNATSMRRQALIKLKEYLASRH